MHVGSHEVHTCIYVSMRDYVVKGVSTGVCVWPCLGLVMDLCPVFINARDRRWGSVKESEEALAGHLDTTASPGGAEVVT